MLAACTTPSNKGKSAPEPCEEGATKPCTCDDGNKSARTCVDGVYEDCACEADGSTADAGANSDASTVPDAGANSDAGASGDAATTSDAILDTGDAGATADAGPVFDAGPVADAAVADLDGQIGDAAEPLVDAGAPGSDAALADSMADASLVDAVQNDATVDAGADIVLPPKSCAKDSDCPGGVCDPWTLKCAVCVVDAHCPASQHCTAGACVPYTACTYIADCAAAKTPAGKKAGRCDHGVGECVECLDYTDCSAGQNCIGHACVASTPCTKSPQCPGNQVCNADKKLCVDCITDAECSPGAYCVDSQCWMPPKPPPPPTSCTSDLTCKPLGQICNKAKGFCAECLSDADCPGIYHCTADGKCKADECKPGAVRWTQPGSCGYPGFVGWPAQLCSAGGMWAAVPKGYGWSESPDAIDCASAGEFGGCSKWLSKDSSICGCDQTTHVLHGASSGMKCLSKVCTPGNACVGNSVQICDADGLAVVSTNPCSPKETCIDGTCKVTSCTPNAVFCAGDKAMTCNATGDGAALKTDCTSKGQHCAFGSCVSSSCSACYDDVGKTPMCVQEIANPLHFITLKKACRASCIPFSDKDVKKFPGGCKFKCGDGVCDESETPATCSSDCGQACGDSVCANGESATKCPKDCATCAASCGGMAPSGCWCDDLCKALGDCCPDAASACP